MISMVPIHSICRPDATKFELNANSLRLKPGVALDYETKSTYSIRINVDDQRLEVRLMPLLTSL